MNNNLFKLTFCAIVLFSLFSLHQKQELLLQRSQIIIHQQVADEFGLSARRFRLRIRNQQPQEEAPRTEKYDEESAPKFDVPGVDIGIDGNGQDGVTPTISPQQIELILQIAIPFLAALLGGSAGAGGFSGFLTRVIAALKAFQDTKKETPKEAPVEPESEKPAKK